MTRHEPHVDVHAPRQGRPRGVLLTGEPMGLLIAAQAGPLESVSTYHVAIAGSEYNVAVGLARLGTPVTYLTKLGRDSFGRRILAGLKANSIGTDGVAWSEERSTGFMLKGKAAGGDPPIEYFRRNSAASTYSTGDLPGLAWSEYSILHLTGIMPALSPTTWDLTLHLIDLARAHGLLVSFDPNLRPQLWPSEAAMREHINELASRADLVLPGRKEGKILTGSDDAGAIARFYIQRGAHTVVVKVGKPGAYVADANHHLTVPGYSVARVVDTVGAGDGFAAGILSGLYEGLPFEQAVARGSAIGSIQVTFRGDNEGLPDREQLAHFQRSRPRYPAPDGSPSLVGAHA